MWEERVDQPNIEACLDTAGECNGEVMGRNVTVAGIRSEPTQM